MSAMPSRPTVPPGPTDPVADRVRHPLVVRRLTVLGTEDLSATVRRVLLGGPDLAGFAPSGVTDHVKLFVPSAPGVPLALPVVRDGVWVGKHDPALTYREFTVRTYAADAGPDTRHLALEMITGTHGPAARWASQARPGQEVAVLGPKTSVLRLLDRARYVLAADESGLPAVRNWLDRLPATAQVTALVEVERPGDEVPLPGVAQVEVTWLPRAGAASGTPLADAVEQLVATDPAGARRAWWWAGAEAGQVRRIRAAVVAAGVERDAAALTGYWRRGEPHFDHKSG